jgi:alkanesulfonate monooxygenase SsuD/methylene tetrahydromethanopterin reductase-like flavin-dependent oxidoreductase (luciferase family)
MQSAARLNCGSKYDAPESRRYYLYSRLLRQNFRSVIGHLVRFAIDLPNFGEYCYAAYSHNSREAEDARWYGCFIWDHLQTQRSLPVADPWISLTAMALLTKRIRLGPLVTPLFRRQPWKGARETVSLDHLSGGRLTLGVGLGSNMFGEIAAFGGPLDDRRRAEMLDESLAIITGLWSVSTFSFIGKHFRVNQAHFMPTPIQSPGIPIWVAGTWPKKPPFRRAARYEGAVAVKGDIKSLLTPAQISDLVTYIGRFRNAESAFDVICLGETCGDKRDQDREIVTPYAAAGATWWIESIFARYCDVDQARLRIRRGPPHL